MSAAERPHTEDELAFLRTILPTARTPDGKRFAKGPYPPVRSSGRRRRYNFIGIVADYLEDHGGRVEDAVTEIFESLMMQVRLGDARAAAVLLDRFCGRDVDLVDVTVTASTMSDVDRAARINAILAAARARLPDSATPRITVEHG